MVSVLAAVAAAAVILIVPAGKPDRAAPLDPQAVEALQTAAHGGLSALGDTEIGTRAKEVARAHGEGNLQGDGS